MVTRADEVGRGVSDEQAEFFRWQGRVEGRIDALENRNKDVSELFTLVRGLSEEVSGLKGKMAGYLVAASLVGTAIAFIAAKVLGHVN